MVQTPLHTRLTAEFVGTLGLLMAVIGSGIMAATLSPENIGVALLANAIATGCALYVLITILGPISGAHFNPAVTLAFALRQDIPPRDAVLYIATQIAGGIAGVWLAHAMFDQPILQTATTSRTGPGQWIAEVTATIGLILTILGGLRHAPAQVPALVGLYITGAYWFTASTSFANPAVTLARTLSDTFAGIAPINAPAFILAQIAGAVLAVLIGHRLFGKP
ncbi:MAG: MIP/aquaporin family protein [Pseudomonadota bacterium]